jgi:hypothetical protein
MANYMTQAGPPQNIPASLINLAFGIFGHIAEIVGVNDMKYASWVAYNWVSRKAAW